MRHFNELCVEDAYSLPRIEDMLVEQGAPSWVEQVYNLHGHATGHLSVERSRDGLEEWGPVLPTELRGGP